MKRLVGPPPGWASEGYGAQWGPRGFRAWALHDREVTWLDWHPELIVALDQAEEFYHVAT